MSKLSDKSLRLGVAVIKATRGPTHSHQLKQVLADEDVLAALAEMIDYANFYCNDYEKLTTTGRTVPEPVDPLPTAKGVSL